MKPIASSVFRWADNDTISTSYLSKTILEICHRLKPKTILDIGCGNGSFTKVLDELDAEILGIDAEEEAIEMARRRVPKAQFEVFGIYSDPDLLSSGAKEFDLVISTEVIEHLYYPSQLLRFAKSKLHPEGRFVISTPYHGFAKNLLLSLTDSWDHHLHPEEDGGHIKFWSKKSLTTLLHREGFVVEEFRGAGRCFGLWKSMILVCRLDGEPRTLETEA